MRPDSALFAGVLLLAGAGGGCAITATAPGGPLRSGSYTSLEPATWAVAYGPASATVDGARLSGNGETWGPGPHPEDFAFLPIRFGVRQSLGSKVEASADLGTLDSGVEVRVGTRGGDGRLPLAVTAGLRSSAVALNAERPTTSARLRLEAFPRISHRGDSTLHWMLSVGASYGTFAHAIAGPGEIGGDVPDLDPAFDVVRPEARLELGVGIDLQAPNGGFTVALAPWILLHADTSCPYCGGAYDFSQRWGVALLLTPSLGGDLIGWLFRRLAHS
jgi:hypothetical protein